MNTNQEVETIEQGHSLVDESMITGEARHLSEAGMRNIPFAALTMSISSISVIINALRLRRINLNEPI